MSEQAEEYRGQRTVIRFNGAKCIHSRNCVLGRPDVFVPNAPGQWIHPDSASSEEIAALALSCPSGAITYERLDGGPQETAPAVNVVRIRENGPLAVHADLEIDGHPACFRATLCRCGASNIKPFCDGRHTAAGFIATGEPSAQESAPLEKRGGKLKVQARQNGPLILTGSIEICTGTGHTVTRTQKVALCRCGASNNKPFCDGTHSRIGFTAP